MSHGTTRRPTAKSPRKNQQTSGGANFSRCTVRRSAGTTAQSWDTPTARLTAQERNRPPKYTSQSALLPPTQRTYTHAHADLPRARENGPIGPRGRVWGGRAHWAHAPLSKKNWIFEWRRLTARFVPFPKIAPAKRVYIYIYRYIQFREGKRSWCHPLGNRSG